MCTLTLEDNANFCARYITELDGYDNPALSAEIDSDGVAHILAEGNAEPLFSANTSFGLTLEYIKYMDTNFPNDIPH